MTERQQLVSWTSRWSKDLLVVIMGFLKKKWLKLLSKRKSKVNVVSVMSSCSLFSLATIAFQIPFEYLLYFLPFRHSSYSRVGHGRVSRTFQLQQSNGQTDWTPFLNFTHFAAILISAPSSPPSYRSPGKRSRRPALRPRKVRDRLFFSNLVHT